MQIEFLIDGKLLIACKNFHDALRFLLANNNYEIDALIDFCVLTAKPFPWG